jgi:hypothetical protein
MVSFLHSESDIGSFLLHEQDVAPTLSWNFSCFSYSGMSLVIGNLRPSASCKLKFGRPRTQAKLIIYLAAVKIGVETLRAKIEQQI